MPLLRPPLLRLLRLPAPRRQLLLLRRQKQGHLVLPLGMGYLPGAFRLVTVSRGICLCLGAGTGRQDQLWMCLWEALLRLLPRSVRQALM